MTTWKRWIDSAALPLMMILFTAGWYGIRAHQFSYLTMDFDGALGMDSADASHLFGLTSVFTLVGYALAAVAGLAVGPLPVVAAGALLCALGAGTLGLAGEGTILLPIAMVSLGYGVAIPGIWGAAARHLGGDRAPLRHGLFVLLWVGLNVGAALAPAATGVVRNSLGFPAVFATCAVLLAGVAILAAGAWIAQWTLGRREPQVVSGFRIEGRRALVAGGVLLLAFLPWTLVFQVYDQLYSTYYQFGLDNSSLDFASIIQLNPVMVIGLGLLVAPLYAVLHATRLRVPALFVAGLGLFLLGLGAIPLMFPQVYVLPPVLVFALLVLAAGEVLAGPLLLSTIVGPWSWRLSTAAAACWLVLTRGSIMALGALGDGRAGDDLTMASVWLGVLLCMLVGLAFAIAAWPLRNVLSSREPDQSSR